MGWPRYWARCQSVTVLFVGTCLNQHRQAIAIDAARRSLSLPPPQPPRGFDHKASVKFFLFHRIYRHPSFPSLERPADRTGGRARKVAACKYIRIYITLRDFSEMNGRPGRAFLSLYFRSTVCFQCYIFTLCACFFIRIELAGSCFDSNKAVGKGNVPF